MNCVSAEARNDWIEALNKVGRGDYNHVVVNPAEIPKYHNWYDVSKLPHQQFNVQYKVEVIFSGTMEKAARSENSDVLRSWKSRFFELTNTGLLVYYTKAKGERKGYIRVRGGVSKVFDPHVVRVQASAGESDPNTPQKSVADEHLLAIDNGEGATVSPTTVTAAAGNVVTTVIDTGGRSNCIELQEGRDVSYLDPEFVAEVRSIVQLGRFAEINNKLRQALHKFRTHADIASTMKMYRVIDNLLNLCKELHLELDMKLLEEAENILIQIQARNVTHRLAAALHLLPRGKVEEYVCSFRKLSSNLSKINGFLQSPLYLLALSLLELGEVQLTVLRLKGVLHKYLHCQYNLNIYISGNLS